MSRKLTTVVNYATVFTQHKIVKWNTAKTIRVTLFLILGIYFKGRSAIAANYGTTGSGH